MAWKIPTLEDTQGAGSATCPCGRITTTDMIADLRGLPDAQRTALGLKEFACDSCRERVYLERRVTRVELHQALGAPNETVEFVRAYVARREASTGRQS